MNIENVDTTGWEKEDFDDFREICAEIAEGMKDGLKYYYIQPETYKLNGKAVTDNTCGSYFKDWETDAVVHYIPAKECNPAKVFSKNREAWIAEGDYRYQEVYGFDTKW